MSPLADISTQVIPRSLWFHYRTLIVIQSVQLASISTLPDELLINTLRHLDICCLKQARLTCRRWSKTGAYSLFHRIYFAPRKDLMTIFSAITENPAFASNITELVYDATMFWGYIAEPSMYARAFAHGFPFRFPEDDVGADFTEDPEPEIDAADEEKLCSSQQRYTALLKEQTSIIDHGQDLDALCAGLTRLPNLNRIWVLDCFLDDVDFNMYIEAHFRWYRVWSQKHTAGLARLSRCSEAAFTPGALEKSLWDSRGIDNLLKAIGLYSSNLKELLLGCRSSKLSFEIFSRADNMKACLEIAPLLRRLKLDCRAPLDAPEQQGIQNMAYFIQSAQQLQELYLTCDESLTFLPTIFQQNKWPALRVLDFGNGDLDFLTLKAIAQCHNEVLRELRIRNMHLHGEETWKGVAIKIGRILHLDFVSVSSLSQEAELFAARERPSQSDRYLGIARFFLSWIPGKQIRKLGNHNFAMAFHKDNHTYDSRAAEIKAESRIIDGSDDSDDDNFESEVDGESAPTEVSQPAT
ncbi:hypothetical protein G7Y79_00075g099130 [Physcia stellaris]|nr:hypothetical protein G7Y79_00075g099130 [Physcia stellaris]